MAFQLPESTSMPLIAMNSNRSSDPSGGALTSSNVKIGGLWKRSQGVSRFTKPNYKHRVFILTDQALSYYAGTVDRVGQMKGRIALDSVRAVEFVDVSAYNLAHSLQVVYVTKKSGFVTLYIIATTKEECSDWVATLRQACYFNRDMLMHYHPGAFIKNRWSCCKQRTRTTLGCQPTYHLLTRSSSRYAQMRRRDTLTSSASQQHRRARAGSRGSHAYSDRDRRSILTSALTDVEDVVGGVGGGGGGEGGVVERLPPAAGSGSGSTVLPGPGRSNSFLELSAHPPHGEEAFTLSSPPAGHSRSRRSSKNSGECSVGVGSMVLTHTSISEIPSGKGSTFGLEEGETGEYCQQLTGSHSQLPLRHFRSERGRKGGRSQVAPTWPTSNPLSGSGGSGGGDCDLPSHRHSYDTHHQQRSTLPRSFKTVTPGLSHSWTHAQVARELGQSKLERNDPTGPRGREEEEEEEEPRPTPPPRTRKTMPRRSPPSRAQGPPAATATSSPPRTHPSPTVSPAKVQRSQPSTPSRPVTRGLKHSKTFTVQAAHPQGGRGVGDRYHHHHHHLQGNSCRFSQSMGTLVKPLIEPKVSASNPNVIHV